MAPGFSFLFANARQGGEAIHLRHVHVEESDVEQLALDRSHRQGAVFDDEDRMPLALQTFRGNHLIDRIILRQQDSQRPAV